MSIGDNLSIIDQFTIIETYNREWDKNLEKILSMNLFNQINLLESITIDWKLDKTYTEILDVLVNNKDANIKSIYDEIINIRQKGVRMAVREKDVSYKKIQRRTNYLRKLNLITESSIRSIDNLDKDIFYYRLTLTGIFYVIITGVTSPLFFLNNNFFTNLLKYHSDNALFQIFLFPYFEEKTLNELSFSNLSVEFIDYLRGICKIIIKGIRIMHLYPEEYLINGNISNSLFRWPKSYPDNKLHYDRYFEKGGTLSKFLSKEMGWNWIEDAKISPNFNSDIINIEKGGIGIDCYIRINRIENEAYLAYDKKKYSFRIEKLPDGSFDISVKSNVSLKDEINRMIKQASKGKLLDLIFSLRTKHQYSSSETYRQTLDNDEKFRDTVNEMIEIIKAKYQN